MLLYLVILFSYDAKKETSEVGMVLNQGQTRRDMTGRSRGASHKKQKINLWPEENMQILLKEYNSAPAHKKLKVKPLGEKYGIPTLHHMEAYEHDIVKGTGHHALVGQGNHKCYLDESGNSVNQKLYMVKSQTEK